jgi:hypothetical protein
MMSRVTVTAQQLYEQIQNLPQESLLELARYIEFLRFKAGEAQPKAETVSPLRVVKLGGILKGYDFSPELLAEARREMWKKFQDPQP